MPNMKTNIDASSTIAPSACIAWNAIIGANSEVCDGAYVSASCRIGEQVYIGPRTLLVEGAQGIHVDDRARLGAGAIINDGLIIGKGAQVQPGAVVTRNVPPSAIVAGNPAVIIDYVGTGKQRPATTPPKLDVTTSIAVAGVSIHQFPVIRDLRGDLTFGEFDRQIPFVPLRYFMVFGVPNKEVRGEHAHRECHQFLICVRGSCAIVADDGKTRAEILLDAPDHGIHLPPMTWGVQYKYSADAILLVFASHHYDAADYIRDYDDFIMTVGQQ